MKRLLILALTVLTTTSIFAQSVSKQLQDMKDAISAQQQQIQQLQQQVQNRDQAIQKLQTQVSDQAAAAAAARQTLPEETLSKAEALDKQYFDPLQHDVTDLKAVDVSQNNELMGHEKRLADLESPIAIHYKGILLTPGGFLSGDTYYRNRALGAEGTPFNSIVLPGASQSHMSEFYGSGRQSRLTLLLQAKEGGFNTTGYYESDFESAGVTSNANGTNGYTLRVRQAWIQAALANGWTFTGGQMWSLAVETRQGMDNRTEAIPLTIDPNYNVGWTYARQYGFRVVKNFNNKFWLGASVENAQINTPVTTGTASNYLVGNAGALGGLYNNQANYSYNKLPDFVFKGVLQPGFGHYEAFVIFSSFRDRIFPNATAKEPSAAGAYNSSTTAGAFGANGRWLVASKKVELGLHFFGDNGYSRYGAAGLPDFTFNPNGTLGKIRNYQTLASFQYQTPKLVVYAYGGGEYEQRRWNFNAKGQPQGYGSPLFANYGCTTETLPGAGGFLPGALVNCAGNTRNLIEGTAGFWYRFYNSPSKGRFEMGSQFSYVVRNTWVGYSSATKPVTFSDQPSANDAIWGTSFRYYLP